MTPKTASELQSLVLDPQAMLSGEQLPDDSPTWCLVVAPGDGRYPGLETYAALPEMIARLRQLDGDDMTVFPFYGIPLQFTPGPFRFLYLPNGKPQPLFDMTGLGTFIPDPDSLPPVDLSYYLGPEELREGVPADAVIDNEMPEEDEPVETEESVPSEGELPPETDAAIPAETA